MSADKRKIEGLAFIALLVGWFVYQNFVAWQYYREHGVSGD